MAPFIGLVHWLVFLYSLKMFSIQLSIISCIIVKLNQLYVFVFLQKRSRQRFVGLAPWLLTGHIKQKANHIFHLKVSIYS